MSQDIIQEYAKAGYSLFPLHGKRPVNEGINWTETPHDPQLSEDDFSGNYGVVLGHSTLVIDIDCRGEKKGKESYARLCSDLGLPRGWEMDTFVVKTGSGGFHIYLSIDPEIKVRKTVKEYPHIEWLKGNMYVVGPNSVHPDTGKQYVVVSGSPTKLLGVPEDIVEKIAKAEIETLGPQGQTDFVDDDPVNVDKFIEILTGMPEVEVGNQRNSAYVAACRGRDLGLSQDKCVEVLNDHYNGVKLVPPIKEEEIIEVTGCAYKYAQKHAGNLNVKSVFEVVEIGEPMEAEGLHYDVDKNNKPLKTLNNAVNYLITIPQLQNVFRYNVFSGVVEVSSKAPWFKERGSHGCTLCDEDAVLLRYFIAKTVRIEFSTNMLAEAIIVMAHKRHYHPVRNYLKSLVWDGKSRLDDWLTTYGHVEPSVYTQAVGRKVLCGAVNRAFNPGCKWDYVMIIEGAQGIGKSTACRILGRNWSGDMILDPHQKDSVAMMLGKWIIELSEMTALKWSDANALKSFLTRQKDTTRLAYARHAKDYLRQSIFVGTVNPEHVGYLNDITGNRRYWVVKFRGPVDLIGLENDCDQLWAEAVARHADEKLYLVGEEEHIQVAETMARMPEDPMRKNVIRWMKENPGETETTPSDVLEFMGMPLKSITKSDQSRVSNALAQLGWAKEIRREGEAFVTYFLRKQTENRI